MRAASPAISLTSPRMAKSDRHSIEPWVIVFLMAYYLPQSISFSFGALQITPVDVIGAVLVAMFVIGNRIRWAWPDLLMVGVLGVHFTAILLSTGPGRALESTGRDFLNLGMPYLVGRFMTQDFDRFWRISRIVVNVLAIMAIGVVIESFTSFNIHRAFWSNITEMPTAYPRLRFGLVRAMGWETHPIMLGLTYAIFLSMTAYAAWTKNGRLGRWPWLKTVAMATGVFLSLSSGAIVAGVIIVGLLLWERLGPRSNAPKWIVAFVGAPLSYLWLEMASGRPLLRILMMKLHLTSPLAWHYRWKLYSRVGSVMPGHYLLGYGDAYPPEFIGFQASIDNHYLVILLTEGWIGLGLWIAFMLAALLFAGREVWLNRDTPVNQTARVVRLTIIGLAAAQFAVALFSTAAVMFWLTLGLSVGLGQLARDGKVQPSPAKGRKKKPARPPNRGSTPPPRPMPRGQRQPV